jgi:uncharacterized protein YdeI (YjbR/CyaY-like superfamily)
MPKRTLKSGVVHNVSKPIRERLLVSDKAIFAWHDITPLARNEWLCWVTSAKLAETKSRRLDRMIHDLELGKRRPCCFAGCIHR